MSKILTYPDSGVLITANQGIASNSAKALHILGDPNREFCSSIFLQLEILPKAVFHRQTLEEQFYTTFFASVSVWTDNDSTLIDDSFNLACKFGLAALDAIHVAAALKVKADEFVTTEKPTKPMFRVPNLKFVSLQ